MWLYGEEAYSQHGINPITTMDIIFETWKDIGKPGLKCFKENMCSEIEASYVYHLLEEIITRHKEAIIDDGVEGKELKEKRMKAFYDYYCWNLKLIDTEKFKESIRILERYIYSTQLLADTEKIGGRGSGLPNPVFGSARA
jgi:hypothetical protein